VTRCARVKGETHAYLQDVPLLERLVSEKLAAEAETVKAEGWARVEAAVMHRCHSCENDELLRTNAQDITVPGL